MTIQLCSDETSGAADLYDGKAQHILVVAPEKSTATRMVYEIPFRLLSGPNFSWRTVSEYYLRLEDLNDIQVLILYRCIQDSTLSLARFARLLRIRVIYELDDDLLEPPEDVSWGKRDRSGHLSQIIKMFLDEADQVKAGSPELARRLQERGYPTVYQPYTAKICDSLTEDTGAPYRIGYFGSPHHRDDIEMITPALLALKEELQEQVEFEFLGCYPQGWQQLKASVFPVEPDYENFLEILTERHWTLGLAPLQPTSFNEAKSNSKFRDYTAAGILGVYADLAPYRDSIIHNQNGWLAGKSPEEWYEMIKKALFSTNRIIMIGQARKLLQAVYSPETVARNWVALLKDINNI